MSESPNREGYEIEPDLKAEGASTPPPPPPRSAPGAARIDAPKLLDGFEEDADFDRDPELERAIIGDSVKKGRAGARAVDDRPEFGRSVIGRPKHWAIAGGVLLLGAMIATAINAPNQGILRVLLALYNTLLHTGTGVVAVFVAALLTHSRVVRVELTAGRMFVAVAALVLVFNLNINIFGVGYERMKLEELVLGVLVYSGIVAATFRLWNYLHLAYVVGSHFVLWLIVEIGMTLAAAVAAAPPPPRQVPPTPPAEVAPAVSPTETMPSATNPR